MAWYRLNPWYWWRRRLFREYQRGWIAASKDPNAALKIPMFAKFTVVAGPVLTAEPPIVIRRASERMMKPGDEFTGWGF